MNQRAQNQPPIYELAITTDRPASSLARRHGFQTLAALADSLPRHARVLDVGAGASNLGREVVKLRPDVRWVNFDLSYQEARILGDLQSGLMDGVTYVAGDACKLDGYFRPSSFDAIFSYWLLPHLSLDSPEPARRVAEGIFSIAKVGGLISVGPQTNRHFWLAWRPHISYCQVKAATDKSTDFVNRVVAATELHGLSRTMQRRTNARVTPFFGTTRYAQRKGRVPYLYEAKTQTYINPFSWRGLKIIAGLCRALTRHGIY